MEEESESLLLWRNKLDDIVNIAHQIRNEDQKAAQELWIGAFKEIQMIWENSFTDDIADSCNQDEICQERMEDGCTQEKEPHNYDDQMNCPVNEIQTILKTEVGDMQDEDIHEEAMEVKSEFLNKEHVGVQEIEEEIHQGSTDLKAVVHNEGNHVHEVQTVQSVHLMISADPGMTSDINPYKDNENLGKKESPFKCNVCLKELRSSVALRKHMASHKKKESNEDSEEHSTHFKGKMKFPSDDRPFKCGSCPSAFKTRGNLIRHKVTHTGDKPWVCTLCGKSYTEKRSLTVHMRTHTGERPYGCTICHKRFTQSGVLQTHMLTHTDKYAYLCYICGRSFRQRSQLVTHCRRHQGIRPFSCSECESKFTTKGDFDRHLRTHTGERPHHCDICGSSFSRAQTLREHKNRHLNIRPYVCKLCEKSFFELTACSRHIRNSHGRDGSKISTSENILRTTDSSYQENIVKERIQLVQEISDKSIVVQGSDDIPHDKKDDSNFITVSNENIEIVGTSDQASLYDRQPDDNSKLLCKDCDTVFSSYKGLNAHGRYCKPKKKDESFEGVPVSEWLTEHTPSYSNVTEDDDQVDKSDDSKTKIEETCESIEYIQEIEDNDVGHAMSIEEDGSITSLPLSQLAPIHIQLENDYMVVLSDGTRVQDGSTATFSDRDIHQVEIEEDSHSIVEEEGSEQRITLVLNP